MRRMSLNARLAHEEIGSPEIEVVLIHITHPDLDAPIRLSTDPTERLSYEPLIYGTRSNWRGLDPFLFCVADALVPSDLEDAPAATSIVLDNLSTEIVTLLRSFLTPPTAALAVVLASSPDLIEAEFDGLRMVSSDITAGEITLSFSREEIELEHFPGAIMSRGRFPGLHR